LDIEKQKNLIVVVGPTAIGKTGLSIQLAKYYNCEIVSADSRQFYQEMTIGTAKPTPHEMDGIPHHFINNISIHQNYTAGDFEKDAIKLLKRLFLKNDTVVLVGGSGLFVNAVCHGFDDIPANPDIRSKLISEFEKNGLENLQKELKTTDPKYFVEADIQNPHRVIRALEVCRTSGKPFSQFLNKQPKKRPFKNIWIGLNLNRETVYENINSRVSSMIKNGLLEEVKSLEEHKNLICLKTVGYQEFYQNPDNQEKAIELVKQNTRRFAKRQITFFKRNKEIKWFEPSQFDTITDYINKSIGR
jgi:tRNA dimethylallyltransferase